MHQRDDVATRPLPLRGRLEASGLPRRAQGAYFVVVALGILAVAAALLASLRPALFGGYVRAPMPGLPVWPATAAFALLFFALQKQGFVFHWRDESTKISLDEIALFVGVLLLPGGHVVLGVTASSMLNQWLHRRDAPKATYNVAQYALAALAAAFAARGLALAGAPDPWNAVAAPVVFSAATGLLVSVLFSRIEGGTTLGVFRDRFGSFALVGASLGVSMGLIVLALYRLHFVAVLAAVPVFLYLRRFGRLSEWADDELKTHKLLAGVSAEVAGRSDLDIVADRILDSCHHLLACGEAQLALTTQEHGQRIWRRSFGEGGASVGGATAEVVDADGAPIGALNVFPKPGQRGYGEREHHLLRTVAGNAASAAGNAHALKVAHDANKELAASERRYRSLFDTAHVLIHVLDADGRIIDANPAAIATLGYGGAELARRGFEELLAPQPDGEPVGLLEELRVSGDVRGLEVQLRRREEGLVHVLLDAKALETPGQGLRYVVFSRDITALKGLEAELRHANERQRETIRRLENMNRELEEFTLWTTHDMREPLRSIGTIAEFLLEDLGSISNEEARDMARRISGGAERLKERVKALHAFSLIVQRDDAFADVDMQRVVDDVIASCDARVREKGAKLVLPSRPLPVVRAQPHRIDQVVANLVENALKYGRAEGPVVEVGFEEAPEEWRFFVRDNGPGVPQAYQERIFQLFQRGPDTGEPGSGAGLAIVKRIVEQHGGRAWVRSASGQGATFWFTLPRGDGPRPGAPGALLSLSPSTPS